MNALANHRLPWTPEEDARLLAVEPRAGWRSLRRLGWELGRTHAAVLNRRTVLLQREQREAS